MTARTNPDPRNHTGTDVERLAYTGALAYGELWTSETGLYAWNGTAWVGGNSTGLSSKYWVSGSTAGPALGYTTVQAAVTAAIADGHGPSDPAAIMIMPGTYAETVTVAVGGIHLVALSARSSGGTIITGNVLFQGTSGTNSMSNLVVAGSVSVSGSASQPITLVLENCLILGSSGHGLDLSANDVIVEATDSTFNCSNGSTALRCEATGTGYRGTFTRCTIQSGGGAAGYAAQLTRNWTFTDCIFQIASSNISIIRSFSNVQVVNATFQDCTFIGGGSVSAQTSIINDTGAGAYAFWGAKTKIISSAPGTVLFIGGGGATATAKGGPHMGTYTKANLPAITSQDEPAVAYASDGTKASGGATGVPVYRDTGTNAWLTFSGDTAP